MTAPRPIRRAARRAAVAAGAVVLVCAAVALSALRDARRPREVPVLMYHNVLPPEACDDVYKVAADEFAAQLDDLLAAGYETVLPGDLERAARGRGFLPRKPVVVTFDDGYEGVLRHAEPELARRGMKAICYAIADRLSTNPAVRETFDSGPLMTAAEARAMARRGVVSLGVHSRTHSPSPAVILSEIPSSRRALLARTGVKSRDYSHPFGQWAAPGLTNAVAAAGYRTAVICGDRPFRYAPDADFLRMPRLSVYGGVHLAGLVGVDFAAGRATVTNAGARLPLRLLALAPDGTAVATSGVLRVGPREGAVVFSFGGPVSGASRIEGRDASLLFRYF